MKRRKFIGLIGAAGAGSLLVGYAIAPSFEKTLEQIIRESIRGLELESGAVASFLNEAEEEGVLNQYDLSKQEFIKAHHLLKNKMFTLPYEHKYLQMRDDLVGKFLLSTDFFINKMNTTRTVKYLGLYDPYSRPCTNPFSSVYYNG
ncbi:hypothetical protein AB9P05_02050 [Roseivirga sp. BDSF3-8]|uniref:hypothetical protein n=1 Tax=Roseivirga sp. BDSF3-8 TaxID=3241598 RepID=UPI003531A4FC